MQRHLSLGTAERTAEVPRPQGEVTGPQSQCPLVSVTLQMLRVLVPHFSWLFPSVCRQKLEPLRRGEQIPDGAGRDGVL